jgi:hypothetical protein
LGKNLIVGACSNYTWKDLKYWVNSIRKSGFDGDVALIGTNLKKATLDKLTDEGVILEVYGKPNEAGDIEAHSNGAPHVERFFYLWDFLRKTKTEYEYVITTDTRDVIFQSNPSEWIDKHNVKDWIDKNDVFWSNLIASSEGLRYKNEPWGDANLFQSFGPYIHKVMREDLIYNVGVIGGAYSAVRDLMLMIFQLSINRPIPIVDQAVYNFIIKQEPYALSTAFTKNTDSWAIQLGTTLEAIQAGSGDIGQACLKDPCKLAQYKINFEDIQPVIKDDGTVENQVGKKYAIVHQYDRIPELKKKIQELYGDENDVADGPGIIHYTTE